ncbi:MAG: hypothetical protein QS98_C0010G0068 [archaeon GW2011_AR3]|nr:MAG: hypothetical protein QS98_C0010G0068 [archaeon GW2011_AR3]MBS3110206.1 type II toxin-antitoxin system RelE/ParE family toxin [Candidatus Woesearchaeota archaeon]
MAFSISFGPQADKFIAKLDNQTKERIRDKIEKLQEDPFPTEVERVESYKKEKVFRVRVGDYRILYVVRFETKMILIARIDKRERAYNKN